MAMKTDTGLLKPTSCLTPKQARDERARAWAFVFECHAKKKAGVTSTGDDMRGKAQSDSHAKPSVP